MKDITGLIGREHLVEKALQEVRKGRHVVLTGQVGVGKSAVLAAVLERLERRRGASSTPNRTNYRTKPRPARSNGGTATRGSIARGP